MRKLLLCVLLLTMVATLNGCRVKHSTLFLADTPLAIIDKMKEAQEEGGAYVFSPEDHDIDAYYLLYSPGLGPNPGPTGPIGPAVRLLKLTYDNENRVAAITIQRYIPQTGSTVHTEGNHAQSWYLIVRLRGPMESFRVMTDEGEEIPVQVIR